MLTHCPKCAKEMDEALDVCPHCKYDFTKQVIKGTGRRVAPLDDSSNEVVSKEARDRDPAEVLPPHMLADEEESVLPPHMLEGAAAKESDLVAETPPQAIPKGNSPLFYVAIGIVIAGAVAAPKFLKKPEPPKVVEAPAPKPAPPAAAGDEEKKDDAKDEAKDETQKPDAAAKPGAEDGPPAIDDEPAGKPAPRRRTRRRVARAPEPAAVIPPDPKPVQKGPEKFRVKGRVLNLETMQPVGDATLIFTAPGGQKIRTATGATGNFRASMPATEGYELTISHKDYESKWVTESGHSSMDEDERKEIAENLRKKYPKNAPIAPGGDGSLTQNYLLVPIPKHGMSMEEALAQ